MGSPIYGSGETSLDRSDLESILHYGRSQRIEFYYDPAVADSGYEELVKNVCGMANIGGGQIFLGVEENGNIKGIDGSKELEKEIKRQVNEQIEDLDDLSYHTFLYDIDGESVLEFRVSEYNVIPLAVDGVFYKRRETVPQQLAPHQVYRLMTNNISDE